jgi:formylglycine-generating enzyme required for sulfatase activity
VEDQDTSRYPVEGVSWEEAKEFCRKLSSLGAEQSAGRFYRLPTEAEWEYACRSGTATPFHFGTTLNGHEANFYGHYPYGTETKGPFLGRPTTVASYGANAFGLYDMHGNVCEWCSDWYGEYSAGDATDPTGAETGSYRVHRGGSWLVYAGFCRSAYRDRSEPVYRGHDLGFRVASVPVDASGR